MNAPLTRHDILVHTQSLDWTEVVEDFTDLTHDEIYMCLRLMRHTPGDAERLASAITQELNRD